MAELESEAAGRSTAGTLSPVPRLQARGFGVGGSATGRRAAKLSSLLATAMPAPGGRRLTLNPVGLGPAESITVRYDGGVGHGRPKDEIEYMYKKFLWPYLPVSESARRQIPARAQYDCGVSGMSILDLPVGAPQSFGLSSLEWVVAEVSEGLRWLITNMALLGAPGATNSHHVGGPSGAADRRRHRRLQDVLQRHEKR